MSLFKNNVKKVANSSFFVDIFTEESQKMRKPPRPPPPKPFSCKLTAESSSPPLPLPRVFQTKIPEPKPRTKAIHHESKIKSEPLLIDLESSNTTLTASQQATSNLDLIMLDPFEVASHNSYTPTSNVPVNENKTLATKCNSEVGSVICMPTIIKPENVNTTEQKTNLCNAVEAESLEAQLSNEVGLNGDILYDFQPVTVDDLPLKVGGTVKLVKKMNTDWYWGRIGNTEGMFPASFVDVKRDRHKYVVGICDYISEHEEDLSFPVGAIIMVEKLVDKAWAIGLYCGTKGLFPLSFVEDF